MTIGEREYEHLRAELVHLEDLLSSTPDSAVIDRNSLEYRKSQVEEELENNPAPHRWPAHVHLSFNGKPVVDQKGIYADFASDAVDAFRKAVASLAASQGTVLGERGVIPNRDNYRLLVTGISHGSFGFELEEATGHQGSLLDQESPVEVAITQAKSIFESLTSDEEAIADAIAETDDRALNDVRGFLQLMVDNEAVCSLSHKNRTFRFRDFGQVEQGLSKLGKDNIQEGEDELHGYFEGFLPKPRQAQLKIDGSGEVLLCRVSQAVGDAEKINNNLYRSVDVTATFRRVGKTRPRYTIVGYELASPDEGEGPKAT